MATTTPARDLERRKRVRLRLRSDLQITPQKYEGRTYYVVKDPVSLRYYRFKEQEHYLIQLMDGSYTLDEAQKAFEKRFRPERLTLEDLEGFAQQLISAGLAQNESPNAGKQLYDQRKKRRRSEIMQALTNILYIKIPVYDPDRLLTYMLNKGLFPSFLRFPIQICFYLLTFVLLLVTFVPPLIAAVQVWRFGGTEQLRDLPTAGTLLQQWAAWFFLYLWYRCSRDMKFIFTRWFFALSAAVMIAA